jgi:hypothetical protein
MRCVVVQYTKQHAECIGLAVEFILKEFNCSEIDVLLCTKDTLGVGWFEFFKLNYTGIVRLTQIYEISGNYTVVFFLSSCDYLLSEDKFIGGGGKFIGLVHQNSKVIQKAGFQNICICPFLNCELVSFKFKFLLEKPKKSKFYADIHYFVTGWQEHLNLHELNNLLVKLDMKCLYISKRYENHEVFTNLIFCERIDTIFIIDCFLHKTCLLVPKADSVYFNERISGCIHLCASFGTKLLMPLRLKQMYSGYDNFIAYDEIYEDQ